MYVVHIHICVRMILGANVIIFVHIWKMNRLMYLCMLQNIWRNHKFIIRKHVMYILWSKVEREFVIEEVVLYPEKKRKRREKTTHVCFFVNSL